MKLQIVLFVVCAVAWTEGFRTIRNAEESTDNASTASPPASQDPCCYPRPPPRKQSKGLKRQASKCCEFPVNEIYEKFHDDLHTCKENRKKEQEAAKTSTTTDATTSSAATEATTQAEEVLADNDISDNQFDAMDLDSDEKEEEEEVTATTAQPEKMEKPDKHHEGKKGKGKCGKHAGRGCGKCIKEAMEKQGWSENGTINWDAILESTQNVSGKRAEEWRTAITDAIGICSKLHVPTKEERMGKHHGKHHHCPPTPEKRAWRCVINNAIMKCPHFPENNEYCVQLREAHHKCMNEGAGQFHWCRRDKVDKTKM